MLLSTERVCVGLSRTLGWELWGWSQPCPPPGPGSASFPRPVGDTSPQWAFLAWDTPVGQSPKRPWAELDLQDFPNLQLSKYISLVNWDWMPREQEGKQIDGEDACQDANEAAPARGRDFQRPVCSFLAVLGLCIFQLHPRPFPLLFLLTILCYICMLKTVFL